MRSHILRDYSVYIFVRCEVKRANTMTKRREPRKKNENSTFFVQE